MGERLLKVLGQIDFSTLDSGERSLPFGLLVFCPCAFVAIDLLCEKWKLAFISVLLEIF